MTFRAIRQATAHPTRRGWSGTSALVAVAVIVLAALLAAACGDDENGGDEGAGADDGSDAQAQEEALTEWPEPNADLANRRAVGGEIDAGSVDELGEAWRIPIEGQGQFGAYASTPIIIDGVVYSQDLASNVRALELETGEEMWSTTYDAPSVGPNGVVVDDGMVFGATPTSAFALDQESGEEQWMVELVRNDQEGIDMAPGYHDGTVYVSTVPGNVESFYAGNGVGILHALDGETGETRWTWNTVPEDLWGNQEVNSGGGLWYAPAFDEDGSLYVSVANPAPWPGTEEQPWGQSRPGPNLHTNSLVKLSEEDGELEWYNQVLPHDVYDWDLMLPPILTSVDDTDAVITGGKMGYVYAMDRETGETIWETPVGEHNGHDDDNQLALDGNYDQMPEYPVTVLPGTLGGVETQMALDEDEGMVYAPVVNLETTFAGPTQQDAETEFFAGTGEMVALDVDSGEIAWTHEFETPPYGAATLVNDLVFTTTLDGTLWALDAGSGEVAWQDSLGGRTNAQVAVAGDWLVTSRSFPGEDQPAELVAYQLGATGGDDADEADADGGTDGDAAEGDAGDGEGAGDDGGPSASIDAMQLFSQTCGGCHVLADAGTGGTVGPSLDQAGLQVDAVAEQIRNGGGAMPAFGSQLSDDEIQALAQYVVDAADPDAEAPSGSGGGP